MKIYGLDFTSAPRLKKPITCAECSVGSPVPALKIVRLLNFSTFEEFEAFLGESGPRGSSYGFSLRATPWTRFFAPFKPPGPLGNGTLVYRLNVIKMKDGSWIPH